uniref:Uncharacterized protein n=1 Tax=Rhizophora mucronata TaxID=61149 RepID=A0A2P2M4C0_RHIMU
MVLPQATREFDICLRMVHDWFSAFQELDQKVQPSVCTSSNMRKIRQKLEEILKKHLPLLWKLLLNSLRCRNSLEGLHQLLLHRQTMPCKAVQCNCTLQERSIFMRSAIGMTTYSRDLCASSPPLTGTFFRIVLFSVQPYRRHSHNGTKISC